MKKVLFLVAVLALLAWLYTKPQCLFGPSTEVTDLKCEMVRNPMGIDEARPRMSWNIVSGERALMQKSYRLFVATSPDKLCDGKADLWDSGNVNSDETLFIPYEGRKLESRTECYWKVCVTLSNGKQVSSEPARWTMGLLDKADWKAKWIGLDKAFEWENPEAGNTRLSARYFRKEFALGAKVRKATLYICGLGVYKLHINGKTVGQQELSPTPTDYRKEVKYNTFDVTQNLRKGDNAIGVVLGNGRFFHMRHTDNYQFPKLIMQMEVELADGSKQMVLSDETWKVTADGPIVANNEYDGEEYDARKEMPGWDCAHFDDSAWLKVDLTAPEGGLNAQLNRNIRVMDTVKPVGVTELKPGTYILDMGQNMVGWLKMSVQGKKDDQVVLRFAEFLNEDGTINQDNLRGGLATDKYTLKDDKKVTWKPCFTSHGFRYVEVTGYPGTPTVDDFLGEVLYDEMEQTGTFETSNELINKIYKNTYWGIRGNYRGMPTDCPQRTERMGWTGDRAIGSFGESFIFDNHNVYAKWVNDIRITQREDGSVSDIAPSYWSSYSDNMTWPGTFLTVSDMLYTQYADRKPMEKHYDAMRRWLYYMRDKYLTEENIMERDVYGDWCTPPEDFHANDPQDPSRITSKAVIGTSYYYYMLRLLEKFALLLDKPADAAEYSAQAEVVKEAYNARFLSKEGGYYDTNAVTANLLSLAFGLVPDAYRDAVFGNVINRTVNDFGGHVSAGIIGCQWQMRELTKRGRADVAYGMLQKTDYPSFGHMIEKGATTIWEHWNGDGIEKWIDSQNHVMLLGDLVIWFYENLAGIKNDEGSIGFKHLAMKPELIDGLDHVTASFRSVNGKICSVWKKDGGAFRWDVAVPANTTAKIYVPATSVDVVTVDGSRDFGKMQVKFIGQEGRYAVFETGSGKYAFESSKF